MAGFSKTSDGCGDEHDDGWLDPPSNSVIFVVADLVAPGADGAPFAVVEVDTANPLPSGGFPATVTSLHWSKEVAAQVADDLNAARARLQ